MKLTAELSQTNALLRAANENVEMILESITDNFIAFDSQWRITAFNKHTKEQLKTLGKNPVGFVGKVVWDEFPNAPLEEALRRAMDERAAIVHEDYYPQIEEWVENRIYPSKDGGRAVFQRYVTARKQAEENLRRSEAYLAEGERLSGTGSGAWNILTGEVFWSREMYRIYGFEPESVKPSAELFFGIVHTEDCSRVEQIFERAMRERSGCELEFRVVRPEGIIKHLHSVNHPVFDESGELTEIIGTILDITERKRAEEKLREEIEERKRVEADRERLLRRIVHAQEDEQQRIAREMHDQFGQNLSALALKLSALKKEYKNENKLHGQFDALEAIVKQLDADIDFLVREMRPTALDDFGLVVALSNYLQNWSKHFGVRAELHASGMEKDRLTSEMKTVLYRVTQEALTNVAKHAKAENVDVILERRADSVSVLIEDDGIGFDGERAFGADEKGFGLIGMRERAALVGGILEIESHPGGGATVVIRIPAAHVSSRSNGNE